MHHRNWLAPVVLGLALIGALTPAAAGRGARGGGLHGPGYYGGYAGNGLRSVNSFRSGNRLYRHRSGYLYGGSQPYAYPQYGGYPYACGGGSPVIVQAPGPDQSCGVYLDPRQDFDCRRDRLLRAASNIDVSYLYAEPTEPAMTVDGPGWVFLRDGEPAKALGRFTARLMRAPGDSGSKIGYALAAALLGDDVTAAAAMEDVMRSDPSAVRTLANAETIDGVTQDLLDRYAAVLDAEPTDVGARVMTVALHALRDEDDAARAVIAAEPSAEASPPSAAAPSATGPSRAVAQRD